MDKTAPKAKTNDPRILKNRDILINTGRPEEKNLSRQIKDLYDQEGPLLKMLKSRNTVSTVSTSMSGVRIWANSFQVSLSELRRLGYVLNPHHAASVRADKDYTDHSGYLKGVETCDYKQTSEDVSAFRLLRKTKLAKFDKDLKTEEKKVNEIEQVL